MGKIFKIDNISTELEINFAIFHKKNVNIKNSKKKLKSMNQNQNQSTRSKLNLKFETGKKIRGL